MEFYPSVGILVLGLLHAEGHWQAPIRMRPAPRRALEHVTFRAFESAASASASGRRRRVPAWPETAPGTSRGVDVGTETVRLCLEGQCPASAWRGYVEVLNATTGQWVPLCDKRFTEHNARVVCRQLGHETLHEFQSFGYVFDSWLSAIDLCRGALMDRLFVCFFRPPGGVGSCNRRACRASAAGRNRSSAPASRSASRTASCA